MPCQQKRDRMGAVGSPFRCLDYLGPGQLSAGGPRMDRRAMTSPGVVKISRLALRLWRSARGDLRGAPNDLSAKM